MLLNLSTTTAPLKLSHILQTTSLELSLLVDTLGLTRTNTWKSEHLKTRNIIKKQATLLH
jgi:hypothetical protein